MGSSSLLARCVTVLLLLGGLCWFALSVRTPRPAVFVEPAAGAPAPSLPAPLGKPSGEAEDDSAAARELAQAERPFEESTFELQVVELSTRRPVTQAEVRYGPRAVLLALRRDEALGERHARLAAQIEQATTDALGHASLHRSQQELLIDVRAEGAWGRARWTPASTLPCVVEVEPERLARVQVLDGDGRPAAGVSVAFFGPPLCKQLDVELWRGRSAKDGLVLVPCREVASTNGGLEPVSAVPEIAAPEALRVRLANEGATTFLRLPPTGSVELTCVGEALANLSVELCVIVPGVREPVPGAGLQALVEGNLARFPYVVPGQQLLLRAHAARHADARERIAGPALRGDCVRTTLACGARLPFFGARVLVEGRPCAATALRVRGYAQPFGQKPFDFTRKTDAEGKLEFTSLWPAGKRGEGQLDFQLFDARHQLLAEAGVTLPDVLSEGRNELGEVVLLPTRTLLSGMIVDEQGQPLANASVFVAGEWNSALGPNPRPAVFGNWEFRADEQGRFALRAPDQYKSFALHAESAGAISERLVGLAPGTEELRIALARASEILGRVRMPAGADARELDVHAERAGSEGTHPRPIRIAGEIDHDGSFRIRPLPGGVWHLGFGLADSEGDPRALGEVEDVAACVPGPQQDARLAPLDLSAQIQLVKLTILDPNRNPIPRGEIDVLEDDGRMADRTRSFESGEAVFLARGFPVRVAVHAPHRQSELLQVSSPRAEIMLVPAQRVRLVFDRDAPLPDAPRQLTVALLLDKEALLRTAPDGKLSVQMRAKLSDNLRALNYVVPPERVLEFEVESDGIYYVRWKIREGAELREEQTLPDSKRHYSVPANASGATELRMEIPEFVRKRF